MEPDVEQSSSSLFLTFHHSSSLLGTEEEEETVSPPSAVREEVLPPALLGFQLFSIPGILNFINALILFLLCKDDLSESTIYFSNEAKRL